MILTGGFMLGNNGKQVRITLLVLLGIILSSWLLKPVEPGPGTPLRMFSASGTDMKVAALTYSAGPDRIWNRLTDPAAGLIPGRVLLAMDTFQMGSGQDIAHKAGMDAARYVLGRTNLEAAGGLHTEDWSKFKREHITLRVP